MAIFRMQRDLGARDFNFVPEGMEFDYERNGFEVTGENLRGQSFVVTYEGDFRLPPNATSISDYRGAIELFEIKIADKLVVSIRNIEVGFAAGGFHNDFAGFLTGADQIYGSRRPNDLFGYEGDDRLKGGGGNDVLNGGEGRDLLIGGRGADDFVFSFHAGRDKVKDFQAGVDDLVFETTARFEDLTLRDVRNGVLIVHEDGKVLLIGVDSQDLSDGDFLFQ